MNQQPSLTLVERELISAYRNSRFLMSRTPLCDLEETPLLSLALTIALLLDGLPISYTKIALQRTATLIDSTYFTKDTRFFQGEMEFISQQVDNCKSQISDQQTTKTEEI